MKLAGQGVLITAAATGIGEACARQPAADGARVGALDILINHAGLTLPASIVQDTSDSEFDRLIAVNLRGTFNGCRFAYPHLGTSRGNVLNISIMAGITGQERHAVYAATKGAINALTESCAVDWGKSDVRCDALCPAGVWTDALRAWANVQADPRAIDDYLNRIFARRRCDGSRNCADTNSQKLNTDSN